MNVLLLPSFASAATRLLNGDEPAPYMLDAQRAQAEADACPAPARRFRVTIAISRLYAAFVSTPWAS